MSNKNALTTKGSTESDRPIRMLQNVAPEPEAQSPSIPETDSGWAAFRVFFAALCTDGLLFGICLSFGVFQDYYNNRTDLSHKNHSSWIGVLAAGIAFLGAPMVTYCCQTFSTPCHYYVCVGWVLCVTGLLSSAFCQSIHSLIATQGLLFGLGMLAVEMPAFIMLNSWFVKRRGLANGMLYGFTDLFGVAWGFLANALLTRHGTRTTFLVFMGICVVIPGIAINFLRERPASTNAVHKDDTCCKISSDDDDSQATPRRVRYYHHATFYSLVASNLLQAFAFYIPFIYLPSYTTALGHSSSTGAVVLAVANIAQVFGEIGFGRLSDKIDVHILVFTSAIVASLSAFLVWSFANSLAYLISFSILFGAFGSGFLALWPRMGTLYGESNASMVFSIMSMGRGLGVIASGPISAALLQTHLPPHSEAKSPSAVKSEYRPVVLFVGGCMAGSAALGCVGWLLSRWKRRKTSQKSELV